jgi:hypothetical protein
MSSPADGSRSGVPGGDRMPPWAAVRRVSTVVGVANCRCRLRLPPRANCHPGCVSQPIECLTALADPVQHSEVVNRTAGISDIRSPVTRVLRSHGAVSQAATLSLTRTLDRERTVRSA